MTTNSETFRIGDHVWDVTRGYAIASNIVPETLDVTGLNPLTAGIMIDVNHAKAMPADVLNQPVLLGWFEGRQILLDGWHRVWLAKSHGIRSLRAIVLTVAESDEIHRWWGQ